MELVAEVAMAAAVLTAAVLTAAVPVQCETTHLWVPMAACMEAHAVATGPMHTAHAVPEAIIAQMLAHMTVRHFR